MSSELVVDVQPKEISIALLENNRLVELQKRLGTYRFLWAISIWDGSKS